MPPDSAREIIPLVTSQWEKLEWIEPQAPRRAMTIADVTVATSPSEHCSTVERWARSVWDCWSSHHRLIAEIAEEARARSGIE